MTFSENENKLRFTVSRIALWEMLEEVIQGKAYV